MDAVPAVVFPQGSLADDPSPTRFRDCQSALGFYEVASRDELERQGPLAVRAAFSPGPGTNSS